MSFIPHPTVLSGKHVRLEPLQAAHIPALLEAAADARIWAHLPLDGTDHKKLEQELRSAMLLRTGGSQYPFAVVEQGSSKVIGSTRLFDIYPEHRKLEIGWTWYAPSVWGNGYNTECKLLLLQFCFEELKLVRVQLKTRENNLRSRAAILKIGAVYEGLLRKDRIMPDGEPRNTVMFSVVDEEWPEVKEKLKEMLK